MIQSGSILKVCDKSGVVLVQCIKVLGGSKKKIAKIGDVVLVSVQHISTKKLAKVKYFRRKRFFLGTIHRGLIIRSKIYYSRLPSVLIKFNENAVVLVNKRQVPISNRVYGPVLRELCMKLPSLGCVTRYML